MGTASLIPKTNILGLIPHSLTKGRTTIGRDNTNDIIINQDTVSWQHAEIIKNGDQYEIYDLNSVNGTFINGKRIKHSVLQDGALVTLADVSFVVKIDQRREDAIAGMVYCRGCSKEIHKSAISCPHCGATQRNMGQGKSKVVAGVLALFLGGLGIHRFYLGQWWGLLYLLFCWTWIPSIIGLVEAIIFFCTDDDAWVEKYG